MLHKRLSPALISMAWVPTDATNSEPLVLDTDYFEDDTETYNAATSFELDVVTASDTALALSVSKNGW